ncbi:MAG TPA: trypsin-like peptidase domain-containing protein, partial [Thermoanaerobaculia bacterium]|nr:trypsin-like peptidase domain-containing protein [Thermoanaerobaculia bacterium]
AAVAATVTALLIPCPAPGEAGAAAVPAAQEAPASRAASIPAVRRTPVVEVVETVSPAVVNIAAEAIVREPDPFFFGFRSRERRAQSLGSGLIIAANGVVVTNAHVVDGASRIVVNTLDGRELEAEVLGSDRDADLAVLKVGANGLPHVELGDSSDLLIGETVVAIGNPFGLSHTVTSGTLSARGRALPPRRGERSGFTDTRFTDFLQTDASINPGNSGGPLVNLAGEVIGVNTAIISGANGIGFAIPADRARRVVEDLLRYGELQPLWTGLRLLSLDPALAREYDAPVDHGALVYRVYPDSPAAGAGFEEGDVIVAVDGQPIAAREDVTTALYTVPAGTDLAFEVRRAEADQSLTLAGERPPEGLGLELFEQALGMRLEAVSGMPGLTVARVSGGGVAAERGLARGDLVLAANGRRLQTVEELGREVLRGFDRGGLLLVVQRGRYRYNLSFPL